MRAVRREDRARPDAHGVRADARLRERVGADQFASRQSRQVAALLVLGAVKHDGQRPDGRVGAVRHGEGCLAHLAGDDRAHDQPELGPTIRFRYVDHEQPLLAGLAHQASQDAGLLVINRSRLGEHLALNEGAGRLAHEPLLIIELLGSEERRLGDGCSEVAHRPALDLGCHACLLQQGSPRRAS